MGLPDWVSYAVPAALNSYSERRAQARREALQEKAFGLEAGMQRRNMEHLNLVDQLTREEAARAVEAYQHSQEQVPIPGEFTTPSAPYEDFQGPMQQVPRTVQRRDLSTEFDISDRQQAQENWEKQFGLDETRERRLAAIEGRGEEEEEFRRKLGLAGVFRTIYQPPGEIDERNLIARATRYNPMGQEEGVDESLLAQIRAQAIQERAMQDLEARRNAFSETSGMLQGAFPDTSETYPLLRGLGSAVLPSRSSMPDSLAPSWRGDPTIEPFLPMDWRQSGTLPPGFSEEPPVGPLLTVPPQSAMPSSAVSPSQVPVNAALQRLMRMHALEDAARRSRRQGE